MLIKKNCVSFINKIFQQNLLAAAIEVTGFWISEKYLISGI